MTDGTNDGPPNTGFPTPQPVNPQPPQFPNQPSFAPPPQFPNPPQFPPTPEFSALGSSGFPPPPNTGYTVQPIVRKKRRWWKILLIVIALLVLLIGGCTALVFKSFKGIADEGNEFLSALYTSADSASTLACPGTDPVALDDVRSGLMASGWKGQKRLNSVTSNTTNGRTTGTVGGTVTLSSGTEPITLVMRKDPKWCVSAALIGTASTANSSSNDSTETTKLR